jgi:2-oxoisovalerate dehydrogenase E1 component
MASIWKLPVLFVCENNQYATEVPFVSVAGNPDVSARGPAYGMPTVAVDGNDVLAVHAAAAEAVRRARAGDGPTLLACTTYRTRPHSEGMRDGGYRTREEVEEWRQRDPLKRLREHLVDHAATLDAIDREIDQMATDALEWAKASPYPDAATVMEHVYA